MSLLMVLTYVKTLLVGWPTKLTRERAVFAY